MASLTPDRDQKVSSLIDQWIRKEIQSTVGPYGFSAERRYGMVQNRLFYMMWNKYSCGEELTSADSDYLSRVIREIQIVDPSFSELDVENWGYGPDLDDRTE